MIKKRVLTEEQKNRMRARCRAWYLRNRERALAVNADNRKKNKSHYRKYAREYYHRHRKDYAERSRLRQAEKLRRLSKLKEVPCYDCGNRFPSCAMEFDHRIPRKIDKKTTIVNRLTSWKSIQRELKKCDIVCANCHRIRDCVRRSNHNTHRRQDGKQRTIASIW